MKKNKIILLCVLTVTLAFLWFLIGKGLDGRKEITVAETEKPAASEETTESKKPQLPDSMLYYGEIQKITLDEEGNPLKLMMESPKDGTYIMNLSEKTFYIDSGERVNFDPKTLQSGDRAYVFYSPVSSKTLPPQSSAFAVVKNIPMDASCSMYHEVEKLTKADGKLRILTDNGNKTLELAEDAKVLSYLGEETEASLLKEGSFIMAWYWDQGQEMIPASYIMLLP